MLQGIPKQCTGLGSARRAYVQAGLDDSPGVGIWQVVLAHAWVSIEALVVGPNRSLWVLALVCLMDTVYKTQKNALAKLTTDLLDS